MRPLISRKTFWGGNKCATLIYSGNKITVSANTKEAAVALYNAAYIVIIEKLSFGGLLINRAVEKQWIF